eukprot:6454817-Amphidinium_carterae.1
MDVFALAGIAAEGIEEEVDAGAGPDGSGPGQGPDGFGPGQWGEKRQRLDLWLRQQDTKRMQALDMQAIHLNSLGRARAKDHILP